MVNPNPIKYSDLITPDNSITDLIAQLTALIGKYDEMRTKLQSSATEMAKAMQSLSGATEEQRQQIAATATESEKLARTYTETTNAERETFRRRQQITQAVKEEQRIDKLVVQLNNAKEGSYNRLSAQYRLNKIRLNEMSAAERQGTEAGRKLERESRLIYEEMSRLQKATGKYTLEVGHYENALRGLPGPLGMMINRFTQLRTTMQGIHNSELPAGKKAWLAMGAAFTAIVAGAALLARSLRGMVKTLADFEQANANLSTILGVNVREMSALTESAKLLGRTTEYTASQVVKLQTSLAKLGFSQGAIVNMQKSILQFATAVGANLDDAAQVAGSSLRAFNLTSADTEQVLATLAVATNKSALDFERIRTSIGTVFPVANAFGISLKDTVALLGSLANAGFDASTAATATRNILLNLADANGKLAQSLGGPARNFDEIINGLRKLHDEGVNVAGALELTDRRSVAAFSALMSGTQSTRELRDALQDVDGELARIQEQRLDTLEGSTLLLKSAWEGLTLSFEESNGVMKSVVDWLTKLITKVNELLFPAQTGAAKWTEQYTSLFQSMASSDNADALMENSINKIREKLSKAYDKLAKTPSILGVSVAKTSKEIENLEAQLSGALKAQGIVRDQIATDADERARQQAQAAAEAKAEQDKLTKEQQKAAKQAAQQRIKDRQAVVESINLEIAAAKEGTDEMLKLRLDKVEAERQLELERNRQRVTTERRDEAAINAKFDADRLKVERDFNKEVAQLAVQRLQKEEQAIQMQISITQEGTEDELALRLALVEKQREIEIQQNNAKTEEMRQSEAAINAKWDAQALKTRANFYTKLAQRELAATQDLHEQEFNLLDKNERQKTQFRIDQEIARLEELLRINEMAAEKMTETEVKAMQATINALKKEKKRLGYDNLYELLGLGLDSEQQSAINTAIDSVKDSLGSLIETWQRAAEAAVQSADSQVEAAQRVLEAEIEARKEGYASREEEARKELDLARNTQAAALEEQRKAQQAQERIDTLTQASSLITASANIWKALSGITGIGPALAVAGIATMWASFAASKVRASQLATEKYGEGTVELLQGGSHASGHDIDLGRKPDGTRRRAEGGEYFAVINKRASRRYRALIPEVINSFNDGTFSQQFTRAGEQMAGYALNASGTDVSGLERDVRAIRTQGEVRRYKEGDATIIQYKNLTRKIKS